MTRLEQMTLEQVANQILTLLRTAEGMQIFDGEPGDVHHDSDGRAHPYACLYFGPGRDDPINGEPLDARSTMTRYSGQVTCAGGDPARARRAAARVRGTLNLARIGDAVLRFDLDPGFPAVDKDPSPPRWWIPLTFTLG